MTAISTFTSAIGNDIARPNRFKVTLPGDGRGTLGILCYQCTLPQRSLKTFDLNQKGVPYRVPFCQDYSPVSFSFYARPDYNTRQYFDEWQNEVVIDLNYNVMGFYDDFVKKVKISTLDRMGVVQYTVKLIDAYPLTVGDTSLNYGTNNTYQTIDVTLSYKYWEAE